MIKNRVITLKMVDGLPVVPGDVFVTAEDDAHYIAYSNKVTPVPGTGGTHLPVAYVNVLSVAGDDALCTVVAADEKFAEIDPENKGEVMTQYKLDAGKIERWPVWLCVGTRPDPDDAQKRIPFKDVFRPKLPVGPLPWTIGECVITAAEPSIPSNIGPVDLVKNLDNATLEAEIL